MNGGNHGTQYIFDPLWVGQSILGLRMGGPTRKGSWETGGHRLPPVVRG